MATLGKRCNKAILLLQEPWPWPVHLSRILAASADANDNSNSDQQSLLEASLGGQLGFGGLGSCALPLCLALLLLLLGVLALPMYRGRRHWQLCLQNDKHPCSDWQSCIEATPPACQTVKSGTLHEW